jgi:hypothetical protein
MFIIVVFALQIHSVFGQAGRLSFDFVDQEIREIIYAMSAWSGVPIIGDDTVTGKTSFQYTGRNFEEAFDSFLLTNRLFVDKSDKTWLVSRVKITVSGGRIVLDSFDATTSQLVDKLTQKTNATILRDILPSARVTLHLEAATPREAVELFMKPFPEYRVEAAANYIQIRKEQVDSFGSMPVSGLVDIRESYGLYEAAIERGRLDDALERLFEAAGKEYVSFARPEQTIERVRFSAREFNEALGLILEQGGGEYKKIGEMFYIFPLQQADIIAGLRNEGKSWKIFETRYRLATEILPLIQARFTGLQTLSTPDNGSFLAFVNPETEAGIIGYMPVIDTPLRSEAIRLKYIKTEDLFRSLPPTVRREEIVDAGDGNTFCFTGSGDRRAMFMKELEVIDRPQPRIRYDLFIIQVQDGINLNWNVQADARLVRPGDRTMVMGQLGNLLNLSFDIVTLFGYQFAAKLNAAISNNEASVFADTTLFGLSGQEIKFQNTSTFRYRDSNIDPDTGKPVNSGVTREIVSGLVLDIKGWVSGDGMITTSVAASVSKRGADVSSTAGNPPPTSEKLLTTQVRARSGETVVLSGLRQNDSTIVEQRVPFISKIPVLGWFFKSRNNTTENTQLLIYLVPHLDLANDEYAVNGVNKLASIYTRFVEAAGEAE